MKRLGIFVILCGLALCLLTGCATDRFYQAGKTVYIAGKQVVIANWDALPKDVQEKLKAIDEIATQYDKAREVLKPAVEKAVKEVKQKEQGAD